MAIYFGLTYFGGDMGRKILYPIRLLVTFLHEFGHAMGAILTGGWVENVQINQDGSGWTRSANGNRIITIMGGYIGSAIFGNILFFIGAKLKWFVKPTLILLAASMAFTGVYWYTSTFTTIMLMVFALAIIIITLKTNFGREVLMFIGLASILFIIQDFNVGPSSDLKAYAEELVFLPADAWKYIWLFIVVLMTFFNVKWLLKSKKKSDFDLSKEEWDL